MKLLSVKGNLINKNVSSRLIKWDEPSLSKIQFKVKQFLKPFWFGHVVYEEFPVYGSKLRVDILNATNKIAVEVHGPQHEQFHYFHNKDRVLYLQGLENDETKTAWLEKNNFKQIVIYFNEVETLTQKFILDKFGITL